MNRGPVAEVDLSALSHNLGVLRNIIGSRAIIAVVKACAYGHGSVEVSERLLKEGVSMLAVAFTGEARVLRDAGIKAPIVVLFDRNDPGEYFDLGLIPVVHDIETARIFSNEAAHRGMNMRVHVKVDTGMGRIGLNPERAVADSLEIAGMKGIELEGLMSHFSEADLGDRTCAMRQIDVFNGIRNELITKLGRPLLCHMANSAASLSIPKSLFDSVRPGLLLYGCSPFDDDRGLRPVMSVKTRLLTVRSLPAGSTVGYGRTFKIKKDSRIGVVPIGYADGYNRLFSNNAEMLVRGSRVPVVGRVCMDLTMVDVTDVPGVSEGDEVVILGRQGREVISASELASKTDTISYEVLTSLGSRARRICLN